MVITHKNLLRLGFYGTSGLIFLYVLLDPYSRQSIFGPTIQGEPLSYWQGVVRRGADPGRYQDSPTRRVLALVGIKPYTDDGVHLSHASELPVLLTLTDDPSPAVRAAVARGLGFHRKEAKASDTLIQLLDDPAAEVRAAAAHACLQEGPSLAAALPRLQQLLHDENALCRTCAAYLLCAANNPRDRKAYTLLVEGLQAGDAQVRVVAAQGLCEAAGAYAEAFAILRDAARQDRYVHGVFGSGASRFGPEKALPVLMEYLHDSDSYIRASGAYAIGELGADAKAAAPALVHALADPKEDVRTAARDALAKIDPQRYAEKQTDR